MHDRQDDDLHTRRPSSRAGLLLLLRRSSVSARQPPQAPLHAWPQGCTAAHGTLQQVGSSCTRRFKFVRPSLRGSVLDR